MIRISQQDCAGAAKKYYSTADYYNEGQELVGSWGGWARPVSGFPATRFRRRMSALAMWR